MTRVWPVTVSVAVERMSLELLPVLSSIGPGSMTMPSPAGGTGGRAVAVGLLGLLMGASGSRPSWRMFPGHNTPMGIVEGR